MPWKSLAVIALLWLMAGQAYTKPFCAFDRPMSLLDRYLDAEMVVVARMEKVVSPDNALPTGQTEAVFEQILKGGAPIKGHRSALMPRHFTPKEKFLLAMEKRKDGIDVYDGTPLDAGGAIVKYVRGGLQLKDKSAAARIRYNVDFLADPCGEVAMSAAVEISRANYADIRNVAEKLQPKPLLKALAADDMPTQQRGTLALLLGHCGKKEHAVIVRKLLDGWDAKGDASALYFSYILLDPDAGWAYVTKASVKGMEEERSFVRRYAAFKAIRRIRDDRKDLVNQKKHDDALLGILKMTDMADFAIEDLRKLKRWEHSDAILDLDGKKGYETGIMRKTLLRFALQCPSARAAVYVNEARARDPEWVSETSELLDLENEDAKPPKK